MTYGVQGVLRLVRLPVTYIVPALVLLAILLIPRPASGLQQTINVTGTSFPLGGEVPITVTLTLDKDEIVNPIVDC